MPDLAPLVDRQQAQLSPVTIAASSSTEVAVAKFDGSVSRVTVTPNATITGAATNNRTHRLVNKGQSGAGTTVVATLTYASGTNATAGDEKTVTLSSTASDLVVVSGDVLEFQSNANGSGIVDPGGLVAVEITRG